MIKKNYINRNGGFIMKKAKKFLSLMLVLIMCFSVMPMTELGFEASAGMTLAQLRQKFPHGKYWNHAGNPGASNSVNNQDGYTSTPCSQHGVVGTSKQTCNGFAPSGTQLSWQCMGYAEKLGYDATGYNPRNNANGWTTYTSSSALNNLKPGDIVRYKSNGHSIYVTGVSGDTVTYTDCNSDGHCIIRWDATISKSTLKSTFTHVRSAPSAVPGGSSASHTRNTSYGTDFSATANEKIDVFNANHSDPGNYYIDKGDKCTIHEVYTDGCCYVTYPISGGTRTYYAPISKFTINGSNPIGAVDSVWGGEGFVHVSGWAFDADNKSTALNIHVYIGDEGHGWIMANKERTDVNNVHGCGNYHGYSEDIKTSQTGTQTVEIYAINVGGGANVLLHRTTVNITPVPKYNFDVNMVINGTAQMSGLSGFTFDFYLNGSLVSNDTKDYCNVIEKGSTWEIKDIKCPTGYKYTGGTTSGTVTGDSDIRLNFACTHSSTEVRNAKSATCTATGYTGDTYCKTCGVKTKTGTSIAKKYHSYTATVTTQPTCTKEGVKTYKCSCGASYTESITKTAHNKNTTIPAVASTCTSTGLTEGKKCSVCGTVTISQQTVSSKAHVDNNGDYKCDYGCGYEFEKPAEPTPNTPEDTKKDCSCNCHKGGISGFFFKLINFFEKLFGKNKVCACGAKH